MSDYYGTPGKDMLHEVTEGYQAALISESSGVSSPRAGIFGSVYDAAHGNATTPSPDPFFENVDATGKSAPKPVKGGKIIYTVEDSTGKKKPDTIYIYKIH